MTTRSDILAEAFEHLALAGYVFDITPEEQASALRKMDNMLGEWEGRGISLAYEPANGDGNLADETGTPAWATSAIAANLAIALAPSFGKTPSPELRKLARSGYNLVTVKTLTIPTNARASSTVIGAGNRGVIRSIETLG